MPTYRFIGVSDFNEPLPRYISHDLETYTDVNDYLLKYIDPFPYDGKWQQSHLRAVYTQFFLKSAVAHMQSYPFTLNQDTVINLIYQYGAYKTIRSYFGLLDDWFWITHGRFMHYIKTGEIIMPASTFPAAVNRFIDKYKDEMSADVVKEYRAKYPKLTKHE